MSDTLSLWLTQLPTFDFVQMIGLLSLALGVLCFYQKDDRLLKINMILMYSSHAVHFALLGSVNACLASLLAIVRTGISLKTASKWVAYGFIAVTIVWGMSLASSYYDMLPIIGSCIGTYSIFCLDGIKMRIGFLCGAFFWLANNVIIGSIGTTILELILIIVNVSTIGRLYFSKRR